MRRPRVLPAAPRLPIRGTAVRNSPLLEDMRTGADIGSLANLLVIVVQTGRRAYFGG